MPDAKWGEAVKAIVVAKPGHTVDPEAIIRRVRAAKGAVYAPKTVDIVDALPLSSTGKVDKKQLRAKYWKNQNRHVG